MAKVYRFKTAESDRRNFSRIACITGADIDFDNDCIHVGLYADGRAPVNFYHSLTVTVEDRVMGIEATLRVEEVRMEGKRVLLRTSPLRGAVNCTILPTPAALLRITTEDGDMMQDSLLPLIDAGTS